MTNIIPTDYELIHKLSTPNENESNTFRLADAILFGFGAFSYYDDKTIVYEKAVTFTCKGRKDTLFQNTKALSFKYDNEDYIVHDSQNGMNRTQTRFKLKVSTICKDYTFGATKFDTIVARKKFMGEVFKKWGIDVDKLSDSIERLYTCPLESFNEMKEFDNQTKDLGKKIKECIEYYDQYGADALFVSSLRWSFQNAILPLIVEQEFYENLTESDEQKYDSKSFLERRAFQDENFIKSSLNGASEQLKKQMRETTQDYLTITPLEMLIYGKEISLSFQKIKIGELYARPELYTWAIQLPQYTRVVDEDGNTIKQTTKEENIVYSEESKKFVFSPECESYNLPKSFITFLYNKTYFEMFFTKEQLKSLKQYAKKAFDADDASSINSDWYAFQKKVDDFTTHSVWKCNQIELNPQTQVYHFTEPEREQRRTKLLELVTPRQRIITRQQQKGEEDAKKDPKVLKIE